MNGMQQWRNQVTANHERALMLGVVHVNCQTEDVYLSLGVSLHMHKMCSQFVNSACLYTAERVT